MDGWVSGSMGGSGEIANNVINLDIIEIIQFCLKIYDLIKIIQFCLKIYDLLRHPHLWVGVWVGSGQMTNLINNLILCEDMSNL